MTPEELLEYMKEHFGENLASYEHEPRRFLYQCLLAYRSLKRSKTSSFVYDSGVSHP